jgi:hypothetical protein
MLSFGEADHQWYEVLEYTEYGTLRDVFAKQPVSEEVLTTVVRQLAAALAYLHSIGLIHRDLKPENILVRSVSPLQLVLSDFGISSLSTATHHFTTRSRTIKYGAPESAVGAVGAASDYWSLGLIVLEALQGRHPFEGLSDLAIATQLATNTIDTSTVTRERWRLLCGGLLTRDPKKRWGAAEVVAWLAGKTPAVADAERAFASQKPYKLAKRECWTTAELALELGRNWKEGERHLARGLILPWLRDELRDQEAANLLIDLTEDRTLSNEERLLRLIVGLGRGLPPVWRTYSLDRETLGSLCRRALTDDKVEKDLFEELFGLRVLGVWGEAGHEDCAAWQGNWQRSATQLPEMWERIIQAGGPSTTCPSEDAYLPSLLLMEISPEYNREIRSRVAEYGDALKNCYWLQDAKLDDGNAAVVIESYLLGRAREQGEKEQSCARQVRAALNGLRKEYAAEIERSEDSRAAFSAIDQQIQHLRAWEAETSTLPELSKRLFEAARLTSVTRVVKRLHILSWWDCLLDGVIFAACLVGLRMGIGYALSRDPFGFISSQLAAGAFNDTVPAGFFLVLLTIAFWCAGRFLSRFLSDRLFGVKTTIRND